MRVDMVLATVYELYNIVVAMLIQIPEVSIFVCILVTINNYLTSGSSCFYIYVMCMYFTNYI